MSKSNIKRLNNIFSLRRSGHHAVISWLQDCYRATGVVSVHINEDETIGHVPYPDDPLWQVFSAEAIIERAHKEEATLDTLIVNYEDLSYSDRDQIYAYSDPVWQKNAINTHDTIIVRDWYNLVASRIKRAAIDRANGDYPLFDNISWDDLASRWIDHAQMQPKADKLGVTWINFNRWRKEKDYRESIAKSFSLNSSSNINSVPSFGGGSSFDGVTLDGKAQHMQLDNRWEQLDDSLYMEYLGVLAINQASVVSALNQNLFGFSHIEAVKR